MKFKDIDYKMTFNVDAVCQLEAEGITLHELLHPNEKKQNIRQIITVARILVNAELGEERFSDAMLKSYFNPAALASISAEIREALMVGMKTEVREDKPRDLYLEEVNAKKAEA